MNYKIVRGERLLEALDEAATYDQLYTGIEKGFPNTTKRQHATNEVNVTSLKLTPVSNGLQVSSTSRSNGHNYTQSLIFTDVIYQGMAGDEGTGTFTGTDGQQHTIQPITLETKRVKVNCNCLDFYHRFAVWNFNADALSGAKPPLYRRKTNNRPPVNPAKVPGMCKHIIKVVDRLRSFGLIS